MINTHNSLYRILPRRLVGRAGRSREKTVDKRSPARRREGNQHDSKENSRKGNNLDEFA